MTSSRPVSYTCLRMNLSTERVRANRLPSVMFEDLQITVHPKLERRLENLAREYELPVSADVVYARDWEKGFRRALTPGSIVLLPMRRAWWSTSEKRMAERLRKLGHTVIWVECT
jgi:hypothetical protein